MRKPKDKTKKTINNVENIKWDSSNYNSWWKKKEQIKEDNNICCACSLVNRNQKYDEGEQTRYRKYLKQLSDEIFNTKGPFQKFMFEMEHEEVNYYQLGLIKHALDKS